MNGVGSIINIFAILLVAVGIAAYLTWLERRLIGIWQDRLGPNRVGPLGLGQVVADMVKIFFKEDWIPPFADKPVFILAPAIIMTTAMLSFAFIPYAPDIGVIDLNIGLLFVLGCTSLSVYAAVLGGYASQNKYALMGSLRAAAQTVSYEVFMGLALMGVVMLSGSFNLREIVEAQQDGWFCVSQFFAFLVFMVAAVAETHRTPFDLPEAEHEIVAGFHTEYSGMKFGMFFVGEYLSVLFSSVLVVVLFFGGWLGPDFLPPLAWMALKTFGFVCVFILLRAALPRPRYDQMMSFGWKVMLPVSLINLLVTGGVALWLGT
ncbi:MAG: NADH-quinone oxidoreductase subunit NuoH [Methylococcales bacterium]|nr:NADH-quinone oxidoreductase subunit NuoH [Methylococcales bacterium]MEE2766364.1 NADH-quinone oxidoreductase subunit NuoH [Pseudomonadota bacterium]